MKEQLIEFSTAKLAKEKGFKELLKGHYYNDGRYEPTFNYANNDDDTTWYSAPTQSLLQKWLREVHNIHIQVIPYFNMNKLDYTVSIFEPKNSLMSGQETGSYKTYEEALEAGLLEALKLIK